MSNNVYLTSICTRNKNRLDTLFGHPALIGSHTTITDEKISDERLDAHKYALVTWKIYDVKRMPVNIRSLPYTTLDECISIIAKGLLTEAEGFVPESPEVKVLHPLYIQELTRIIKQKIWVKNDDVIENSGFKLIDDISIKTLDFKLFETLYNLENGGNVLMVGPSGSGKTSIPEAIAKHFGMNFLRMNCASIRDPEEWFGFREAQNGSTVFLKSQFVNALEAGNCVIVLDELNRLEPWLHNSLLPLLDHARKTNVHNIDIEVKNKIIFVATLNLGGKFTGTFALDAAMRNRMDATIYCDYIPKELETNLLIVRYGLAPDDANMIIDILSTIRKYTDEHGVEIDVSTRTALKIAKLFSQAQLSLADIITYVILNNISEPTAIKNIRDIVMESLK